MMNKNLLFFIIIISFFYSNNALSQCGMRPLSLTEKVINANHISKGTIINKQSFWDKPLHNIYTVYTMQIESNLKGGFTQTIDFVEQGGHVGNQLETTTIQMDLDINEKIVACLVPTTHQVEGVAYEIYGGPQGCFRISKQNEVTDIFGLAMNKENFENEIEEILENNNSGKNIEVVPVIKNLSKEANPDVTNQNPSEAVNPSGSITSFTPNTITGGTRSVLTINGSGFGATRGTSFVEFKNVNTGLTAYIQPLASEYVAWSNTQIRVIVPSLAGTDFFRVSDGTNTLTSATVLTVDYGITTLKVTNGTIDSAYQARHINDNTNGGYTFRMSNNFAANAAAAADIKNVLFQWQCKSNINWSLGANTAGDSTKNDGTNVIRFDAGAELPAGVLGVATSRYTYCASGGTIRLSLIEVDLTMDDGTNYYYTSPTPIAFVQYDFYSVALHELGHALQLSHVSNSSRVMYYSIANNSQLRNLASQEIIASASNINTSALAGYCGNGALIKVTPPATTATFALAATSGSETSGSGSITIAFNNPNCDTVTYSLALLGSSTATNTVDFNLSTAIRKIPPGSSSSTFTFSIIDDLLAEGNETINFTVNSISNASSAQVTGGTVFSFSILDNELTPLLCNAINLQGLRVNNQNALTWNHSCQDFLNVFEVLHSKDGSTFQSVATISNINKNLEIFTFDHKNPTATDFYKIIARDAGSNQIQESNTIKITGKEAPNSILVYPSPAREKINILQYSNIDQEADAILRNATGETVLISKLFLKQGSNLNPLNINTMPNGIYFLTIKTKDSSITQRVIVTEL
jgi:hypothetical protein